MKAITLEIRIDEYTNKMATAIKHTGFGSEESVDQILITIGALDNVKQEMLNQLNNKSARIK